MNSVILGVNLIGLLKAYIYAAMIFSAEAKRSKVSNRLCLVSL